MRSFIVAFVALIGATLGANAQCVVGNQVPPTRFNSFNAGGGYIFASGVSTTTQAGTLQSISIWSNSSGSTLVVGMYKNDGASGTPGSLIGTTAAFTAAAGWNTVNTTTHPSVAASQGIYFAVIDEASADDLYYDVVTGQTTYWGGAGGATSLPSTYSVGGTEATSSSVIAYATLN